jgi:Sec-independent protein secretion pathway component TatC
VPLWLLYETGILVAVWVGRKKSGEEEAKEETEEE